MARILFLSSLLFLIACTIQPGLWTWRHADATYAERHLARDIYECEEYAQQAAANGPRYRVVNARDYGGWGNFDFEFCMQERNWRLEFVPKGD